MPSGGKWYLKDDFSDGWSNYDVVKFTGPSGAQPYAADWDGDNDDNPGFYVPSQGKWYLKDDLSDGWAGVSSVKFKGTSGSIPVAGKWGGISGPCYLVSRSHVGEGSDPVAHPLFSPGCPTNRFLPGDSIVFSAKPGVNWQISSWTGTNCAICNVLTMPMSSTTVTAHYIPIIQ